MKLHPRSSLPGRLLQFSALILLMCNAAAAQNWNPAPTQVDDGRPGPNPVNSSPVARSDDKPRTLRVVLYPIIPGFDDFASQLKRDFEAKYPAIKIEYVDLRANYYDPYYEGFVGSTSADVYELDSVFLQDFVRAGKIQPLPAELASEIDSYLDNARRGSKVGETLYGLPHWVCSNFMLFRTLDKEIESVKTISDLSKVIGTSPAPDRGALIDLKGKSTLGEWYLAAEYDLYSTEPFVHPHLEEYDKFPEESLRRVIGLCNVGNCRNKEYHKAEGAYAKLFSRGKGRVFIGYSENLFYVNSQFTACSKADGCISDKDLNVNQMPLAENESHPISWVDTFVINSECAKQCQTDATEFIRFADSEGTFLHALLPSNAVKTPRYLLPARASLYNNQELLAAAPLYPKFKAIVEHAETPKGDCLNCILRGYGAKLDETLPTPK
jgi:thiamine pyridinylase